MPSDLVQTSREQWGVGYRAWAAIDDTRKRGVRLVHQASRGLADGDPRPRLDPPGGRRSGR